MKQFFILFFTSMTILAQSQITLEQKLEGELRQTRLTRSGSKMFLHSNSAHKLTIYNSDFTVFKSIDVPDVNDESAYVDYVSDSLFNTDDKIEYAIEYWVEPENRIMVLNEDGDTLLNLKGTLWNRPDWDIMQGPSSTRLNVSYEYGTGDLDSTLIYLLPGRYEPLNQITGMSSSESQLLSLNNNTLSISGGNSVSLAEYSNTDQQKLSFSNDTLYLENGGWVYIGGKVSGSQVINLDASGLSNATPNPASKVVAIQYVIPNNEYRASIKLINSNGQIVDAYDTFDKAGNCTFNLENYAAGMYFVQLETRSGFQSKKKLIVLGE